ncbi:CBS domain-containing protein [Angustibacter peucedani]
MRVSDIMSPSVVTVTPDDAVDAVVRLLATRGITTVPVVDDGQVVAMVGEADVVRVLVPADPRAHARPVPARPRAGDLRVRDLMSSPAWTTEPGADVHDVAAVLAHRGWKSAAVVDDGRLVGVVSRSDVIRALSRPDDETAAEVRQLLRELGLVEVEVQVRRGVLHVAGAADGPRLAAARQAASTVVGVRSVAP